MSTEAITTVLPPRYATQRERHWLLKQYDKFHPSQGWTSFIILALALVVIGLSVQDGAWVPVPGLQSLLFLSAVTGLGLAKIRIPAIFLHPFGLAIGALLVTWRAIELSDETSILASLPEMWSRLTVWYEAATNDGISTDLLPFTLLILTMSWLIGYTSSFFVFRISNAWVTVVLGGVSILTNLSFLPPDLSFSSKFFLFTLLAMLLVVRLNDVQNEQRWRTRGIRFEMVNGWLTMHAAIWFGLIVMLMAAILPLKVYVSRDLANWWNTARSPVASLEEDVARLLAGIPSRKNVPGRFFGKTLPFIGSISFGGEPVFWATTDYPSYWLSNTYSEYTSQGWKAGETTKLEVGESSVPPPRAEWNKRAEVAQTVQLNFDSDSFLAGGNLDWLSHDAVVETLRPKDFMIDLHNPESDGALPEDIQEVAQAIRDAGEPPQRFVESYISRLLPDDLVLNSVGFVADEHGNGGMVVQSLNIERKPSPIPEIVSWKFAQRQPENHPYTMISYVSVATDEDLRKASANYSAFITDHYLQLPTSLPQRVRDKAVELTARKDNPYDKAVAISDYLRSETFTYSQDIEAPPRDADGVDFFLFETQTGYSDYFASSMVVMLRAVDVPARLAAGYAPGEYDPENDVRVIRDHDSHGWVQVFFPEYGWIDFEPTPRWPEHERRMTNASVAGLSPSGGDTGAIGDPSEFLDPFSEIGLPNPGGLNTGSTFGNNPLLNIDIVAVGTRAGIALGVAASAWLLLYWLWNLGLRGLSPVEKAYARMNRLGALAGLKRRAYQTPNEYAAMLSSALGETAPAARRIAREFAALRYTGAASDDHDDEMEKAWRSVRGALMGRAFRRLLPGGNQG
jgi:hypothetical protein